MKKLEDYQIIESVLRGNKNDYNLLINRYKHKAYSLCMRITGNEMDAEEVLQDSFLKAYKSLSEFRKEASFSTWFYRIVYNTALSKAVSKHRKMDKRSISLDKAPFFTDNSTVESLAAREKKALLKDAVDTLPTKYAAVITLFYLEEMSIKEVAEAMDISISNSKVLLHRARGALRELIYEKKLEEELQ